MTPDAILSLVVVSGVLVGLAINRWPPEWLVLAAVSVLLLSGILTPEMAFAGFSNPGMLTVGALYVVAGGVQETGALRFLTDRALGRPAKVSGALSRIMPLASLLSAFLNNTPIVALLIGPVQVWAKKLKLSASRLLLPLSYAAIMGGTLTLIGTSTNLVVDGLLQTREGHPGLGILSIAPVGLAVLAVGTLWMLTVGWRLLPERKGLVQELENPREYSVVMRVLGEGPLVGLTLADANLRHLEHCYLAEIERRGSLLSAVGSDRVLQADDRLIFVGVADCAHEVRGFRGLEMDVRTGLDLEHHQRRLVEVVLSPRAPIVGQTVRSSKFRDQYKAVILAVSRDGERIASKIGDIVLKGGDTLLLETSERFVEVHRYDPAFLLVSTLDTPTPPNTKRANLALLILLTMVGINLAGVVSIVEAALAAAVLMVFTGCLTPLQAGRSLDGSVLVVIAGSLALGAALTATGAAAWLAAGLMGFSGTHVLLALVLVYLMTIIFTELITNNAAAVLMFPIAVAVSEQLGVSVLPFAVAVMFAASASFLTPLGYQTNLMVYGPGGYKLTDYLKAGFPMTVLTSATAILVIPMVFPF